MMKPLFSDVKDWAASLVIDFPNDNIPRLERNSDWKEWGNSLVGENSFSTSGAPGTHNYSSPRPWMIDVYKVMLNNQ